MQQPDFFFPFRLFIVDHWYFLMNSGIDMSGEYNLNLTNYEDIKPIIC